MEEDIYNIENKMITYKERMKELENRGIDTSVFLSDWCVLCGHSYLIQSYRTKDADGKDIRIGVCATGCNGVLNFEEMENNGRHFLSDKYQSRIRPVLMKNSRGKIIQKNVPVPICYEEVVGVEF